MLISPWRGALYCVRGTHPVRPRPARSPDGRAPESDRPGQVAALIVGFQKFYGSPQARSMLHVSAIFLKSGTAVRMLTERNCEPSEHFSQHAPCEGDLLSSKCSPKGEVEAIGTGQRMLSSGYGMNTVKPQTIRPAPDHDIAVDQRNAPSLIRTPRATPEKDGR